MNKRDLKSLESQARQIDAALTKLTNSVLKLGQSLDRIIEEEKTKNA